jgi:hypothetical protein
MRRRFEQGPDRTDLDEPAEIENADATGEIPHQAQIVGDEDVGEAERTAELDQQFDDLGLDRHVERRSRLVEHDQSRLDRERARDRDALLLAARQFMRVPVAEIGGQFHHLQQARDATFDFRRLELARLQRDRDRLADRAARIERRARILEHHLDGSAARRAGGPIREVASLEQDRSLARLRQSQDHPRDGRFARPALAREPEDFALGQLETDVGDRLHLALDPAEQSAPQRESLAEADDFEQRDGHAAASSTCQQAAL